ncbi:hypothetical protein [Streptomyces anatolicus]|uniref:hypothetical protein n=1 Tax=Streptomyces anatolicus TaxID=2675858 RepID=UPI0027E15266|nr:hypothetical protein [Streptomyces anatolicus]
MNDTPNQASPTSQTDSPDLVQVVLGECSAADADTVFTVLREHFPSDRGDDAPTQTSSHDPAVWTGAFRASRTPEPGAGVLLAGTVTADLQGGPIAVERLRAALDSAFAVTAKGTVSGDQEVQVQLLLSGAEHGEHRERA